MKEFDFRCDHNIDLFIKCAKDLGAKITPGTGKLFVNGKEMNISETLDLGFSSDLQKEFYDGRE